MKIEQYWQISQWWEIWISNFLFNKPVGCVMCLKHEVISVEFLFLPFFLKWNIETWSCISDSMGSLWCWMWLPLNVTLARSEGVSTIKILLSSFTRSTLWSSDNNLSSPLQMQMARGLHWWKTTHHTCDEAKTWLLSWLSGHLAIWWQPLTLLIAYYSTAVVTWLLNCLHAVPKNSEHTQFLRTLT